MGNEIDFEELKYKNRDDFVIIDIRDAVSFEYGHIPGSINIPQNEVVERVKKFNEKKRIIYLLQEWNIERRSCRRIE